MAPEDLVIAHNIVYGIREERKTRLRHCVHGDHGAGKRSCCRGYRGILSEDCAHHEDHGLFHGDEARGRMRLLC